MVASSERAAAEISLSGEGWMTSAVMHAARVGFEVALEQRAFLRRQPRERRARGIPMMMVGGREQQEQPSPVFRARGHATARRDEARSSMCSASCRAYPSTL